MDGPDVEEGGMEKYYSYVTYREKGDMVVEVMVEILCGSSRNQAVTQAMRQVFAVSAR